MVRSLYTICLLIVVLTAGSNSSLHAQQQIERTPQKGLEYIENEDFQSAEQVYAYLLKKYPSDAAYNFYMGICLLNNRSDLSQAIKMLNYARVKKVSRNVYYYLGRAHQLSFRFDEAIANFDRFLVNAPSGDSKRELAQLYLEQCSNSRRMASKIYDLKVINKVPVLKNELLKKYKPVKDVGKLYRNGDFFEAGVDPNNVMFETERGDVVYFAMATNDEDTLSIYKMEKLLDGWGESKLLSQPLNSPYNDAYPFLETDGLTFYFSSNRPGGFGGYDMYKIYYDSETRSFLEPINLGVPFNSPDDDFLFVSDEFNSVAWFASNRETTGDTVMVYTIKWDGTQVRSMVEDVEQITESAKLLVEDGNGGNGRNKRNAKNESDDESSKREGLIRFVINDTLVYSNYDDFVSAEALQLYREGYQQEQRKDSLSVLMKRRRYDYAKVNNEEDRNQIVNDILNLEAKVYSLEDEILEKYLIARQRELAEIKERIRQGTYQRKDTSEDDEGGALNLDGVFIPEKYVFHTSDEFERHFLRQVEMYKQLFTPNDIESLRYADSLYVWANILNLESSRLMEESAKVSDTESFNLGGLMKKVDSLTDGEDEQEAPSKKMIKESKELKLLSTRIYHKSLDKKYTIYYLKLKDAARKLTEAEGNDVLGLSQQGNAYFREAKSLLNEPVGLSLEAYERAGAIKRTGIEKQERALRLYAELSSNPTAADKEVPGDEIKGVAKRSYAEIHRGEESEDTKVVEKPKVVKELPVEAIHPASDSIEQSEGVFKIQIGVFKNAPKQEALDKIPPVSKLQIEGTVLTKYFSGNFKSSEEAQVKVADVVEAGFEGAFVVYFKDGKLSAMPQK